MVDLHAVLSAFCEARCECSAFEERGGGDHRPLDVVCADCGKVHECQVEDMATEPCGNFVQMRCRKCDRTWP